jgi:hypothetical protein
VIDLVDEAATVKRREEVDLLIARELEEIARTTARISST